MPTHIPDSVLEHAFALLVRVHGADALDAETARVELARWAAASDVHRAAIARAEHQWQVLGNSAGELHDTFPLPDARAPRSVWRTRALPAFALACCLSLAVLTGVRWWHSPVLEAHYASTTGTSSPSTSDAQLPDGTSIALGPQTKLDVTFYRDRRHVEFAHGEAYFDVAHDGRPFVIDTRLGRVTVVGTAFSIVDRGDGVRVAVARGQVRVETSGHREYASLLPGHEVALEPGGGLGMIRIVSADGVGAWRHGWLVFEDRSLSEVVDEIRPWLDVPVRVEGARTGSLHVTASLQTNDLAGTLGKTLPAVLPVSVRIASDHTLVIGPR
jgi:transmembrane sensor